MILPLRHARSPVPLVAVLLVVVVAACLPAAAEPSVQPSPSSPIPTASPAMTASPMPSAPPSPPTSVAPPPSPTGVPSPPPTPAPVVTPTPALPTPANPTATRPSPTPAGPSVIVSNGSRATNLVALTFDMGGRAEPVIPIMEWLRDHGVRTTIFVAGSVIDSRWTDVGRRTVEIMEANPHLFEMASHGYGHPDMRTQTLAEITAEIRDLDATLARIGARTARPFFRPPSGYWKPEVLEAAGSLGYRWTVLWDVDPIDWKTVENGGPTADDIVTKVVGRAQGGSVILLHLSGTQTLAALPRVVDGLRAKGLEPAFLADMFR